jgi:hypothetical protein
MDHTQAMDAQASERYLLGELPANEAEDFERHYFECEECALAVEAGRVFIANARAVFAEGAFPPVPEAIKPRKSLFAVLSRLWERPAILAPSIASLLFFAVVLYQDTVVIPGMRRTLDTPRALPVFQLPAATRGAGTHIDLPAGTPSLALSADIPPGPRFPKYRCELTAGDRTIFQVTVPPPDAGQPVTILVPTRELQSGQYALTIYGIGPHGVSSNKISDCLFDFQIQ